MITIVERDKKGKVNTWAYSGFPELKSEWEKEGGRIPMLNHFLEKGVVEGVEIEGERVQDVFYYLEEKHSWEF